MEIMLLRLEKSQRKSISSLFKGGIGDSANYRVLISTKIVKDYIKCMMCEHISNF